MTLVITTTLLVTFALLTLVVYRQNVAAMEDEMKQEADYICKAIEIAGTGYLDEMDEASIVAYDIPTGVPLVYTLSDDLRRVESRRELGNAAAIAARKAAVRKQGSALR